VFRRTERWRGRVRTGEPDKARDHEPPSDADQRSRNEPGDSLRRATSSLDHCRYVRVSVGASHEQRDRYPRARSVRSLRDEVDVIIWDSRSSVSMSTWRLATPT